MSELGFFSQPSDDIVDLLSDRHKHVRWPGLRTRGASTEHIGLSVDSSCDDSRRSHCAAGVGQRHEQSAAAAFPSEHFVVAQQGNDETVAYHRQARFGCDLLISLDERRLVLDDRCLSPSRPQANF